MKRHALIFTLLCATVSSVQAEDFWHDSVRACIVGGGVIGASSALLLYSAAAATISATATLPASTIVFGNTVFGCGLGTMGTMFVYGIGSMYQNMIAQPSPPVAQPESSPQPQAQEPATTVKAPKPK